MYIHSYIHAYIYVHAQTHKHAHTHTHTHRCIMYIYKYIYNTTTINRSTSGGTHEQHMSNTLATHQQHITRSTSGWFSLWWACSATSEFVVWCKRDLLQRQKRPTIEAKETCVQCNVRVRGAVRFRRCVGSTLHDAKRVSNALATHQQHISNTLATHQQHITCMTRSAIVNGLLLAALRMIMYLTYILYTHGIPGLLSAAVRMIMLFDLYI